ncbi:hypothetical protein B0H21DRAFT_749760 [Amylocystis lapponica]|nr:hypothetical protein B0H21DRAFT_749760 [Amylocystis lapponica]
MTTSTEVKASTAWYNVTPPTPKKPYSSAKALDDISALSYALHLFLASHMVESEKFCHECDPKKERLYFATGNGLIQCVKGLMSFEDEDLLSALKDARHGNAIASQHRKRTASLATRLAGLVVGSLNTSGVGFVRSMSDVERHAELVYAESLFEKALLGIVYSGDWLAFIKEALNMRTTINIYRQLGRYLEVVDAEAQARGEGPEDSSVDAHFRSGVYLGVGLSNVILSLMPSKLLTIVELFGYKGDRQAGLAYLQKPGGWSSDAAEPTVGVEQEGLRRATCDMALLIFHLVLSSFTIDGVDIIMAQKILDYHLKRYPNGVFFLFMQGRLCICRSQPAQAVESFKKAMSAQDQYRNLHHISNWEIAVAELALWDVPASLECWRELAAEATWSKATYTYGTAVCLLQLGSNKRREEAASLMDKVSKLRQRIAGKSIPLEFAYMFLGIAHAPRETVIAQMLPLVEAVLAKLKSCADEPSTYEGGHGYWDDMCLAQFLKGVCLRSIAYPVRLSISQGDAERDASAAFEVVYANAGKIEFDHHFIYYAHYEHGHKAGARQHLELVMSGKPLEGPGVSRKGKYSMENALHVRVHAALEALDHKSRL